MSSNGKRNRGRQPYMNGKDTAPQPGDEVVGGWSHAALERMDARFCERVRKAIANRKERLPDEIAEHMLRAR
jgi:hypothetical protein